MENKREEKGKTGAVAFAEATMAFVEAEAAAASRFTTMMFYGAVLCSLGFLIFYSLL